MSAKDCNVKHDPVLNNELFEKYIVPNFADIRSFVFFYSANKQDVDSNFNYVIAQMWKYIHTYNPAKPLKTWLHIVAKRTTMCQNQKQAMEHAHNDGANRDFSYGFCDNNEEIMASLYSKMVVGNVIDNLSDKTLSALQNTPPVLLSAFLLYYQGYKLQEIVDIEYQRGNIKNNDCEAKNTMRARIGEARKIIKKKLAEYGIYRAGGID